MRKAQDAAWMPAVELNCSDFRGLRPPSQLPIAAGAGAAAPAKRGRAELYSCRHFLKGAIQGEPLRAALVGQDLSPANRALQTSLDMMFLVVSKLRKVRKFKW